MLHRLCTWVAHDVICFDSFLDQKMLERWLLRCHSSVVVVKFWVLRPVIVTVVICWDVMLRILVPNLFYFDLGYFFVTPWCYLVYDVSHPWVPPSLFHNSKEFLLLMEGNIGLNVLFSTCKGNSRNKKSALLYTATFRQIVKKEKCISKFSPDFKPRPPATT